MQESDTLLGVLDLGLCPLVFCISMLAVPEAIRIILAQTERLPGEKVPLYNALGRILAESIIAEGPPPTIAIWLFIAFF